MLNSKLLKFFNALTRKKVIDSQTAKNEKLQRKLTTVDLMIIGVTSTLGISIYIILGATVKNVAGPGIILSLVIDALAALMSGIGYAELATRMPVTGSAYTFTTATMGEALGFFVSWNLLFEYSIGTALFARGLTGYLNSLLNGKLNSIFQFLNIEISFWGFKSKLDVPAAVLCLILTAVIVYGWEPTNFLLSATVIGSTCVISIMIIIGFVYGNVNNWTPFTPYGLLGVVKGASTCFYSFVGYDVIAMSAGETLRPRESIPTAIIGTIGFSAVLFVGMAMVLTLLVPYKLVSINATFIDAFKYHGLHFLTYIIFFGMVLGSIGGLIATLIPLPRLVYAMSEDGLFFSIFSRISDRNGVPYVASIVSGVFAALVALCFSTDDLIKMTSMGTLMAYSSVCLCVIVLRYRVKTVYLQELEDFEPGTELTVDDDIERDELNVEAENVSTLIGNGEKHDSIRKEKERIQKELESEIQCSHKKESDEELEENANMQQEKIGFMDNLSSKMGDEIKTLNDIDAKASGRGKFDGQGSPLSSKAMSRRSFMSTKSFARFKEFWMQENMPSDKSETIVNFACFCLVIQMTALGCIIVYGFHRLISMQVTFIFGLTTITISTIVNLLIISAQPENPSPVFFRVPVVPWFPALSLFLNIYLILLLDRGSWIRFGIWLLLGMIFYFGYGIHRSKVGQQNVEFYTSVPEYED